MSEAEVISHIAMRAEFNWELGQWWVGACIAVIVAAHLGAEHLTRKITILILFLFTLYTIQTIASMQTQQRYVSAAYQDLEALATTSELSNIAQTALANSQRERTILSYLPGIALLLIYLSTSGFVVYRRIEYKKLQKREPVST